MLDSFKFKIKQKNDIPKKFRKILQTNCVLLDSGIRLLNTASLTLCMPYELLVETRSFHFISPNLF